MDVKLCKYSVRQLHKIDKTLYITYSSNIYIVSSICLSIVVIVMPKIIKKKNIVYFEGISIKDFLVDKFLKKLKERNLHIEPISIVFIVSEKDSKKEVPYPIVLNHENKEEIAKKILHISTQDTTTSQKFIELLEEME